MVHRRTAIVALALTLSISVLRQAQGATLVINEHVIEQLKTLRKEQKFIDKFGIIKPGERAILEPLMNNLIDRLIAGVSAHPEESWVIEQMNPTVEAFYLEDTELREPCVDYLLRILRILGIRGANGAFKKYFLDF
jgi:hypothetical protein